MKFYFKDLRSQFISLDVTFFLCIIGMILVPGKDDERINEAVYVRLLTHIWRAW